MTGLMAWLALSGLMIALAILVALRSFGRASNEAFSRVEILPADLSEAADALAHQQMNRIFGSEDWDFVRVHASKNTQQAFLRDRKELALCWIALVRSRAKAAMHRHVSQARELHTLQPAREARMAMTYFLFVFSCALLSLLVALFGPLALRGVVRSACRISDRLRDLTEIPTSGEVIQGRAGTNQA